VDTNERIVLLNSFKRYRCARKLGMGRAPYAYSTPGYAVEFCGGA
jgi:hypothetical protein